VRTPDKFEAVMKLAGQKHPNPIEGTPRPCADASMRSAQNA
jgi:hypothetical protein